MKPDDFAHRILIHELSDFKDKNSFSPDWHFQWTYRGRLRVRDADDPFPLTLHWLFPAPMVRRQNDSARLPSNPIASFTTTQ